MYIIIIKAFISSNYKGPDSQVCVCVCMCLNAMTRKNEFLRIYLFYCFSCFLYLRFQNRYQEEEERKPPLPVPRCQVVWNADALESSPWSCPLTPSCNLIGTPGPEQRATISSLNGNGTSSWSVWKENKYTSVHWLPSCTLRYVV